MGVNEYLHHSNSNCTNAFVNASQVVFRPLCTQHRTNYSTRTSSSDSGGGSLRQIRACCTGRPISFPLTESRIDVLQIAFSAAATLENFPRGNPEGGCER